MRAGTTQVLGIAGSLREGSYNRALLEAATKLAPEGMEVTVYDGLGDLPPFNADVEREPPLGVVRLRAALARAEGVLISTPEYNQSLPGVLKNMIDWLSRGDAEHDLVGKPVAVIGATTGPWGTRLAQTALRQILLGRQALLLPGPALFVRDAATLVDPAGHLDDEETRARLEDVLVALGEWIDLVAPVAR